MAPAVRHGRRVLLLGSYAPSLVNFRGPLIAALRACGHHVTAAAPDIDPDTCARLKALGADPRSVPISNTSLNPLSFIRSAREVSALLRSSRADALITYTAKPIVLGALAARRQGVERVISLVTGLGYAFTGGLEVRRLVGRTAASLLYRLALERSDVVLFQNPDDQAQFRRLRLLPPGTTSHVVRGSGVDIDHFAPVPVPVQPHFLMIARLLKDKGIREFTAAARRLKERHPEIPVTLIGRRDRSPDSLGDTDMRAIIDSGIDLLGHRDDVRPSIARCSVFVLPSYREGTPRSVLEAMAMGRAIITTDAPGCRETVSEGINGFLVPPRDPDALHMAMERFVETPELAVPMGAQSRRLAEERYDARAVSQDIIRHCGLETGSA